MHIKFLNHGKGNAAKASAYLLDKFDHLGNIRAGIEVLQGDATTFNAICDASPHLWKYTSGVIAWSKDDAPTDEQIREVLTDFEQHAFSGLDPSQYHLFAVQHTDDDGSKHIHVLVPRLDLQSGKSLNIAPPGHEKHFDSLRDYFNTKYQWSRPDDLLLMHTTQEPNHVAKLNKHAKNILSSQELETLPKKQFCKAIDNYVQTLLKTQTAENRADIVACITQLDGIDSIKPSKEFLTVTLNNGNKHRLKGDFYHEKFEIGSYSEHLRAAAASRPTPSELAAALQDADQLRATYRAKRAAYNQQHLSFAKSTTNDNSPRIAYKLDFDRDRESITPSHKNAVSELYGANRGTSGKLSEYRYCGNFESDIEHRFVFNLNSGSTNPYQQPVAEHLHRQTEFEQEHPSPSTASHSKAKRTDREPPTNADYRKTEQPESELHSSGSMDIHSVDALNDFLSGLSIQFKSKNHRSAARNDTAEFTGNNKPNQLLEQFKTEVSHADRDRPIFNGTKRLIESTKQLVSRAKRSLESTGQFIKEHFDRIQRSRAELKNPTQTTTSIDFSTANRAIQDRTGQLFRAVTTSVSGKLENPIDHAINQSIKSTGFEQHCQGFSKNRIETNADDHWYTTGRHRESTLEDIATQSTRILVQGLRAAERADQHTWESCRKIDRINKQLERLETVVDEIRLKPKPATDFSRLRSDGYYPDYVSYHKKICEKQQQAYENNNPIQVIENIKEKLESIQEYMSQARHRNLTHEDYDKLENMVKNDQRMLKYMHCEKILEPRNDHLARHRDKYEACLTSIKTIKMDIQEIKNPSPEAQISRQRSYEPEPESKPKNDFGLGF
ncbi:relaxase/mobilization nuclease domain-containing protein [Acinetobacter bereziniae]|uniref:relaxase/mobilization nuclease domain-containing protein n=2 Tax=Acinetobacter TaxID=469 RepID=UPI001900B910|nr:mobilization protein [Acinetobacter bereziniae]MBJ8477699.1 mobilization protein [Acinetobacter bereziniae]